MAELPSLFDPTEEIDDPFAAMPAGWYTATIKESLISDNKAGTGKYLKLGFNVNGGDYDGKTIFAYLNIINKSDTAEAIAKRDLQSICNALGLGSIEDSNELHGQPMKIKLKVTPATAQYGEGNSITNYANMEEDVEEDGGDSSPF